MLAGMFARGTTTHAVKLDAVSIGSWVSGTSVTIAHTTGAGENRYMQVAISFPSSPPNSSGVTYNGVALTKILGEVEGNRSLEVWELIDPPSGEHDLVITLPDAGSVGATVRTFRNVDQSSPVRDSDFSKAATGTAISNRVDAEAGDLVIDALCLRTLNSNLTSVNPSAGQSMDSRFNAGSTNAIVCATSRKTVPVVATVEMGWTWIGDDNHIHYAAALALAP